MALPLRPTEDLDELLQEFKSLRKLRKQVDNASCEIAMMACADSQSAPLSEEPPAPTLEQLQEYMSLFEQEANRAAPRLRAPRFRVLRLRVPRIPKVPPGVVSIDIGGTQAAELCYGDDHVAVHSGATGCDYDYDYENPSEPTVLCLSIWPDMKFLPLANNIEKALLDQVQFFVENPNVHHHLMREEILEVYKTDYCVIDLESEADTVICSCGHQCLHHANISASLLECPLCRSPITAFIPADGLMMNAIISRY